jgi:hypothetical protein
VTKRLSVLLAAAIMAAACSDSPGGVTPSGLAPSAAVMDAAAAASGQSADVGTAVAVAPAVVVRNGSGDPVAGTLVRFAVTRGGGTVAVASARTDTDGLASAGEWTLGTAPGPNEVTATVAGLPPVQFTATAVAPASAYRIETRWIGSATARQKQAVTAAVERWQTVVVTKLPSVPVKVAADACFDGQPALNETVDDLLIFIQFTEIDGAGKVLGEAGPCLIRTESNLPALGHLKLDAADLDLMERNGTLDDVVLHEIGHILGIGTLWKYKELLTGAGGDDPLFTGSHALDAYLKLGIGSAAGVPVENTGSAGTRDGHWRETVFSNELMTGYINSAPNPLSAVTVQSLKDLGYGTSLAGAGTFALGGTGHVHAIGEPIDLRAREKVKGPKFRVDRFGRSEDLPVPRRH